MQNIRYSITVPVYNEEDVILKFIESFERSSRPDCECVIVDDSTDETPELIKSKIKGKKQYKYIHNKKKGRCEARNLAINLASGFYVFIWNADVIIPKNFFNLVDKYAEKKLDVVGFRNEIIEGNSLENYLKLYNEIKYFNNFYELKIANNLISSTEGFMVKKDLAISAYPEFQINPLVAGDDFIFARMIEKRKKNIKSHVDFSIIIKHYMPNNFIEFYNNRKGRGYGTPQISFYYKNKGIASILIYSIAKFFYSIIFLFFIPLSYKFYKKRKNFLFTKKKFSYLDFFYINLIERIAIIHGEISSLLRIFNIHYINKEKKIKYID